MKLLVVRHGQTRFNAEGRYLRALDPELNATGISQAHALNAVLPITPNAVVCSPLRQARQTAEIVCQAPEGGESIAEVVARVTDGLQEMYEKYEGKVVVLVAHGFVAKAVRAVTGAGFDDFFEWQLENGSVYEIALTAIPRSSGPPRRSF